MPPDPVSGFPRLSRRGFLASGTALVALAGACPAAAQDVAQPFTFDLLTEAARQRAAAPDPAAPPPDPLLSALDYSDYQRIAFRQDHARWARDDLGWRLAPFHLGWLFGRAVVLHEVSGSMAREMDFSSADFDYREGMKVAIPPDYRLPGVAGFVLTHPLNRADFLDEVVSFLGASYFRALGVGNRYGVSARGLAVDSGLARPEEFPRFSEFWIERPAPGAAAIRVWASLDSTRLTGAYQFVITPGPTTTIEVTARLFFREAVEELGIAPLTSMFLFAGINRAEFDDYRPQVHDSDGLRIVRADGDVIWRALQNPAELASSYLSETSPRRFGLFQRERDFAKYQDAGARYDLRPSLDVEPLGDWGEGAVRLFEIPTRLEVHDNIGAFWVPARRVQAGDRLDLAYRLHWGRLEQDPEDDLAVVAATLSGVGGTAGNADAPDTRKFVVDFRGGLLGRTPGEAEGISPVVTVNGGKADVVTLSKLPGEPAWRLTIDVAADSGSLVEMTAHIAGNGRKLSEIWVFQWRKP